MQQPSTRAVDFTGSVLCFALIAFSLYLEIKIGLQPCPLCTLQRFILVILGVLFLFGGLVYFGQTARRLYHFVILLTAAAGITVSARHVWLQHLPPGQVPTSCGATLNYMLQLLPVNKVIQIVFQGSGECAKQTWHFLHLSIPMWCLLAFSFFAVLAIWQILKKDPYVRKD